MNQWHSQEKMEPNRIDPLLIWVICVLPGSHSQSTKTSNASICCNVTSAWRVVLEQKAWRFFKRPVLHSVVSCCG